MRDYYIDKKVEYIRGLLAKAMCVKLRLRGNSMWPFLKDNDEVLLSGVGHKDINIGDIVLVYLPECLLCHRVFRKKGDRLRTKADSFFGFDPWAESGQLIGKVIAKQKKGRLHIFKRRSGPFILYFTLFISFIYPLLRIIRRTFLKILKNESQAKKYSFPRRIPKTARQTA